MENICIWMEQLIADLGFMIINMVITELKHGLMEVNTKVATFKEKNRAKEDFNGQMDHIIKENST